MAARLIERSPARSIIILLGLGLTSALLGCSPSTDNGEATGSADRLKPDFIGEHIYDCPDGSRLDVDFLGDGLTLDLKTAPDSVPVRVTAPASGLTFVGPNLNVTISDGDRITLLRPGAPPLTCKRAAPPIASP